MASLLDFDHVEEIFQSTEGISRKSRLSRRLPTPDDDRVLLEAVLKK